MNYYILAGAAALQLAAAQSIPVPSVTGSLVYPTVTLLSTNPAAVPLSQITANLTTQAVPTVTTTYAPGASPTYLKGAPPLPTVATIIPSNYPTLDVIPPTDSPQVQQWIKDVANSGVAIPGFAPTVDGGCASNAAAAADQSRCWWTCGGCTRETDISSCPNKFQWGLTYDDGPAPYTPILLQYLDSVNLKATFFVVGSRAISYPLILQQEYMAGHQIGVHTWSHHSLTEMTNEQIIAELGWSKKIIKDVIGVTPNIFRAPFGDMDDRVRAIAIAMGLTPTIWTRISPTVTFDTGDYDINAGTISAQSVLQNWEFILGNASQLNTGFIVLEHDLFPAQVDIATGYVLPDAVAHSNPSYDIKPIVACLNKPMEDAYIETNSNSTNPPLANLSGSAVILTSGASGSVQSTGKPSSSQGAHSAGTPMREVGVTSAFFLVFAGMIAGVGALLW